MSLTQSTALAYLWFNDLCFEPMNVILNVWFVLREPCAVDWTLKSNNKPPSPSHTYTIITTTTTIATTITPCTTSFARPRKSSLCEWDKLGKLSASVSGTSLASSQPLWVGQARQALSLCEWDKLGKLSASVSGTSLARSPRSIHRSQSQQENPLVDTNSTGTWCSSETQSQIAPSPKAG